MSNKNYTEALATVKENIVAKKAEYDELINKIVDEGKAIITDFLKENGLDGDVLLTKKNQRGTLEVSVCKKPLNGDFYVSFLPYKKDGSKYSMATERRTIIPNEEATLKTVLDTFSKAPDEPSATTEQTVM